MLLQGVPTHTRPASIIKRAVSTARGLAAGLAWLIQALRLIRGSR
jgi:hypothetical protein